MSTPILQPGDQIHVALPAYPDDAMIEALEKAYAARGVTIFRITELSISRIEIISIIRAVPKPTVGQMMTGFRPPAPMPSSAA